MQIENPQRHIGIMKWGLYKSSAGLESNKMITARLFNDFTMLCHISIGLGDEGHLIMLILLLNLHQYFFTCSLELLVLHVHFGYSEVEFNYVHQRPLFWSSS